jgi:hypothetical protein
MFVTLRSGMSYMFPKYITKEDNLPVHNFTVPIVDCSYVFRLLQINQPQAVDQKCVKETVIHVAIGWYLDLIKVVTYVVCLQSSVNGNRKQTKQKIQTN